MFNMELTVQTRKIFGEKVKALREQGLIPAELYGHKLDNLHLTVPRKEFSRIFKEAGESTVIKLRIENLESRIEGKNTDNEIEFNVLVHDIDKNALTDEINHIDFYAVKKGEKIKVRAPLRFIGESAAVKEKGAILIKAVHELEIEALPDDLLHHIEVDISKLIDLNMSILVKDLKINPKVKVSAKPETVIASVIEQKEEVVVEEIKVEEVKVEGEEKKAEKAEKEKEEEQAVKK